MTAHDLTFLLAGFVLGLATIGAIADYFERRSRMTEPRHNHFDDRDARDDCPACADLIRQAGG